MSPSFLKKPPVKPREKSGVHIEPRKYIDLNQVAFEDEGEDSDVVTVRIAEIYRYEDAVALEDFIYKGDIIIVDYSPVASDELVLKRVISELKNATRDVRGDIAGKGKNELIVTPKGIHISRKRLRGMSSKL